jgi:Cu(I)/Ag(I) efflux system protein CusF
MKLILFVPALTALLLAACSQSPSNDTAVAPKAATTDDMAMPATEHAQMAQPAAPASTDATPSTMASATGTVEGVDATAGKITIAHGPVEALGWPAMTMGFTATPEQIASVKTGQKVNFEFQSQGMEAMITRISPDQ